MKNPHSNPTTGIVFEPQLPFHHHNICSHFDVVFIFFGVVHVIDHPIDCYFSLLLFDFCIEPNNSFTFIRMPKTVVYHTIWDAEFGSELGEGFTCGIEA